MNQTNKRMQLTLTKTALRVLNEQELQQVGGGENIELTVPANISMVWVTNNTTTSRIRPDDMENTLESSRCDAATISESSYCDAALPFASNP
jgi:hypothetical protein